MGNSFEKRRVKKGMNIPSQLRNPIDTSDQDRSIQRHQADRKHSEHDIVPRPLRLRIERLSSSSAPASDGVVRDHHAEDGERDDLEHYAGDHKAVTDIRHGGCIRRGGDAAAGGLQEEGEDVGGDETPGVEAGWNAGVGGGECECYVFEC